MKRLTILATLLICGIVGYVAVYGAGRPVLKSLKRSVEHKTFVSNLPVKSTLTEHFIQMPDGVGLATDVYVPDGGAAKKPVILVRLPYGKRYYGEALHWVRLFSSEDYVVVV